MHSLNCPPCTYHSHILNLAAWTSTRVYKNCVRPQVHSPQCPASSINWNRCTGSTDHDMHIILLKTLSGFNNFYFRSFLSLCNKPQIIYFPRNKFSLLLKWSKQPNKDYFSLTISCMKKKVFCLLCETLSLLLFEVHAWGVRTGRRKAWEWGSLSHLFQYVHDFVDVCNELLLSSFQAKKSENS